MLRILQIVPDIDGGGVGSVVYNYLTHMNLEGLHVDIVTEDHGYEQMLETEFQKYGISVKTVSARRNGLIKHFCEIKNIMKENQYDVVHSHQQNWSYFYLRLAKKYGAKVRIAHSHCTTQLSDLWKIRFLNCFNPLLKRIASGYFACGYEAGMYMWGKKIADEDLYIMNNAVDLDKFKFNPNLRNEYREKLGVNNKFVLGHVGRFEEQKNHFFLITMFAEFVKVNSNAVLILVGKGTLEEQVKKLVRELNISEKVIFLGLRNDIYKLLNAFDAFVLPSLFEGLPVVAIEAQANGLPCILSNNVTEEVVVLKTTKRLELLSIKPWVDTFIEMENMNNNRSDAVNKKKKKKYSIQEEAESLRQYYMVNVKVLK